LTDERRGSSLLRSAPERKPLKREPLGVAHARSANLSLFAGTESLAASPDIQALVTPSLLAGLQSTAGNRAVQRLVERVGTGTADAVVARQQAGSPDSDEPDVSWIDDLEPKVRQQIDVVTPRICGCMPPFVTGWPR
jgi:hypothetical protein